MRNEPNICSTFVETKAYASKLLTIIGYNWFNLWFSARRVCCCFESGLQPRESLNSSKRICQIVFNFSMLRGGEQLYTMHKLSTAVNYIWLCVLANSLSSSKCLHVKNTNLWKPQHGNAHWNEVMAARESARAAMTLSSSGLGRNGIPSIRLKMIIPLSSPISRSLFLPLSSYYCEILDYCSKTRTQCN